MILINDGSKHDYSIPEELVQRRLILLTLTIYKYLARYDKLYVRLSGKSSEPKWEEFKVNDEVYIDADYGIKE